MSLKRLVMSRAGQYWTEKFYKWDKIFTAGIIEIVLTVIRWDWYPALDYSSELLELIKLEEATFIIITAALVS